MIGIEIRFFRRGPVAPARVRSWCRWVRHLSHENRRPPERRTLFGDTNESVNKKMHAVLTAGLVPIVCIGETLAQRDNNETMAVLDRQIKESLDRVTGEQLAGMVLAYEPVWAIGTGRNATPAQAGEAHFHIRSRLKHWFGLDAAERCRVVYGGSVKPDNIAKLVAEPDVDGALVGGASLDPKSFYAIIQGCGQIRPGAPSWLADA